MEPVTIPIQYVRQRVGRPKKYFSEEERKEVRRAHSEKTYRDNPEKKIEQVRKYRAENIEKLKEKAKLNYLKKKENPIKL
jgi:hypothetical protein